MKGEKINIFFAIDENYTPFLAVTLQSLVDNIKSDNEYCIRVLYAKMSEESKNKIKEYESENVTIEFVDFSDIMKSFLDKLYTRDYYSKTTYYRLFIPEVYKDIDKALYIDSDVVILDDIANLYNTDLENNLVGATTDMAVSGIPVFADYVEKVVGVRSYKNYFNAGVLLMNLKELRNFKFQEKFLMSLNMIKFSVAQDQDYLNRICKGRVKFFDKNWNRMPLESDTGDEENVKLIHFNLAYKPWHFENIKYQEYFWKYANKTKYVDKIASIKNSYTKEQAKKDALSHEALLKLAKDESDCVGDDRVRGNM